MASLLRNHSSKTVSILTYLPRLARRPCLLRHPLPDQHNLGLQRGGDLTPGALTYVFVDVQVGALDPLSFASWFSSTHFSWGSKVGHDPISFVVLLTRLSWGIKVGHDLLSFVVLFPVQPIPVD